MDRLDNVFAMQKALNDEIVELRGLHDISDEEWIKKNVLAMVSELSEVLDEVNFKWWKNEKPVDQKALQGELVDVFHFFLSMCLKAGMNADDLYAGYLDKNRENFDRQHGLSSKEGYVARGE